MERASSSNGRVQAGLQGAPRVVVSGGAGFIGAAFVRECLASGAEVLALDDLSCGSADRLPCDPRLELRVADVGDPGVWRAALDRPAQAVVHLASIVGVERVLSDPEGCRASNCRGFDALAQVLEERGLVAGIWAASTSEVYAESAEPLSEGHAVREGAQGRLAYAASKLHGERRLAQATGGRATLLRFFNVVGPGQSSRQGMLLPRFVERARAGLPLPVHGDGSCVRTFAHVDEVARTLAWLVLRAEPGRLGGALNIGGTAVSSVLDIAAEVARLAGSDRPRIAHLPAREGEVQRRVPDLARLAALGAPLPCASLRSIVEDAWLRHPQVHAGPALEERACASLAS